MQYIIVVNIDITQDLPLSHIEDYRDMILEEDNRLYDRLLHHFINSIMDDAVLK